MGFNQTETLKLRVAERRRSVAADYVAGVLQSDLAQKYGVTQATISRDLMMIRRNWMDATLVDFNAAKTRELERIDTLELHYWDAWEESRTAITNARGRTLTTPGDPEFLKGVQWCIEQRCKIFGLYAPVAVKNTHAGPNGNEPVKLEVVYVNRRAKIQG